MSSFILAGDLIKRSADFGVELKPVEWIAPPNYKFRYIWDITNQRTDDIVLKKLYSTSLSEDNDILNFIKSLQKRDIYNADYHYFDSTDARDSSIIIHDHDSLFEYCKARSIGRIETSTLSPSDWGGLPDEEDATWESVKIDYNDLPKLKDDELWTMFMWIIADAQQLEKHYSVDFTRAADYIPLLVSRQRFATGSHVITYNNFDHSLQASLLSSLRKYFAYYDNETRKAIRLTIIFSDPDALSGKKAIEFIDKNANYEEFGLSVRFGEYCYNLMNDNVEKFNKAYTNLVDRIKASKEELAQHILNDSAFVSCSSLKLRLAYIENLLSKDDFRKYKPCFQLTDNSDWIEQQAFIEKLHKVAVR